MENSNGELEKLFEKRLALSRHLNEIGESPVLYQIEALQELILLVADATKIQQENASLLMDAVTRTAGLLEVQKEQKTELQKEVIKSLKLDQPVEVAKPSWYKEFNPEALSETFRSFLTELTRTLKKFQEKVIVRNSAPKEAIPVRFVTKDGQRFYDMGDVDFKGSNGVPLVSNVHNVTLNHGGSPEAITPLSVDETGSSNIAMSIPRNELRLFNAGTNIVAFGGEGLSFSASPTILPNQWFLFDSVKKGFKVHFITESGKTSTIKGYTR